MQLTKLRCDAAMPPLIRATTEVRTVWEAGHYYAAKGPTVWAQVGWDILTELAAPDDARLLFVDDVHGMDEVGEYERELDVIEFVPDPSPTYVVTESSVLEDAYETLERLAGLSRRKRARKSGSARVWRCSGHSLTRPDGTPLCLLYDLGLIARKWALGYTRVVNILPASYEIEQRRLTQIARKAFPDLVIDVVLYEEDGSWRWMVPPVLATAVAA